MYIKSIIIDGFKSYAQRTEVNGFDPYFNAITGLNGSGKSNILDSICFLLGISNLQQVRATNLQELVYKNGQAGVTKATVSITFDNSDKNQSPLGYEQYEEITITRQVVIGGRNKYLINGSNANNTRVQDLFRSVQLNVNNPHFLIMQGRITKVLNMKPPEILSMIEEAAGTRLYESKKESAQKTIEKKDAKLKEIDTILQEEITPTLARLKEERSSYLEYQKVLRELEHLNKLCIAYKFVASQEISKRSAEELVQMQETIQKHQERHEEINKKVEELDKVIDELQKQRDQEAGGAMEKLETAHAEASKAETKAHSNLTSKKDTMKQESKKLTQLKKQHSNDENAMKNKEKELEKIQGNFEKMDNQYKELEAAVAEAQKHYHAVSAGLSSNKDGDDASLNDQLMNAKKEVSNSETEKKKAQMRLKHEQQEIKKKQADLKKSDSGYKKDQQVYEVMKTALTGLQAELDKLNYQEGRQEELMERQMKLKQEVRTLRGQVDTLESRFPQLQFDYRDPEKNFDRSRVKGLVARLITLKDPQTATALEVAAGGQLYNVVVDSDVTGKKILQNGQLRRRVTIIPLNKITSHPIDGNTVRKAQGLVGKGNAQTALSLVGYGDEIARAMEFVFGSTFVCPSMDQAKKVTFDPQIRKRSVTLDGDSFNPAGLLTGGSRNKGPSILAMLADLNAAYQQLDEKNAELRQIEAELAQISKTAEKYNGLKKKYDLKAHEMALTEERLKQSNHHQQLEEIKNMEASIAEQEQIIKDAEATYKHNTERVKELEDKVKNAKALREKELKQAEKDMQSAKKKLEDSSKNIKDKRQAVDTLKLEVEDIGKDLKNCEDEMKAVEDTIKGYEEQIVELQQIATEMKAKTKEALDGVNKQKELLKSRNKDINEKLSEQRALQKESNEKTLQVQELEHKVTKSQKDAKEAAKVVEALLQQHSWIAEEKKYFGQANTAYDFKAQDPKEAAKRIDKLDETKDKLAKSVNMRAMSMLGKAEEQYNDLMRKRKIVLNDKAKIAAVIRELDEKKNEALKNAHTQVTKDFGSIFCTLLPGTQAKLVAPEGCSILDGLEVKVAFGDVWKESLSELSGGQRSLVALSLILSLLLFKPAPLYILDEVDAALDLSHTQNIGQMLRTHFTHSQFIVVSLKDGMFNNANVLFKTKFIDGVSTVTRYAQQQPTRPLGNSNGNSKANKEKGKKAKRMRKDDDLIV